MLYSTLQWIERGNDKFAERRTIEHNSLSLALLLLTESFKVSVVHNYYFVVRLILIMFCLLTLSLASINIVASRQSKIGLSTFTNLRPNILWSSYRFKMFGNSWVKFRNNTCRIDVTSCLLHLYDYSIDNRNMTMRYERGWIGGPRKKVLGGVEEVSPRDGKSFTYRAHADIALLMEEIPNLATPTAVSPGGTYVK